MTLDKEAENSIKKMFLPFYDERLAFEFLQEDLRRLSDLCLDSFLKSKSFVRKEITTTSQLLAQSIVDECSKILQWSAVSDEGKALHRAYSDMVINEIATDEAAKKHGASVEDLEWFVQLRPPNEMDKDDFKLKSTKSRK